MTITLTPGQPPRHHQTTSTLSLTRGACAADHHHRLQLTTPPLPLYLTPKVLALPITIIGSNFTRALVEQDALRDIRSMDEDLRKAAVDGVVTIDELERCLFSNNSANLSR